MPVKQCKHEERRSTARFLATTHPEGLHTELLSHCMHTGRAQARLLLHHYAWGLASEAFLLVVPFFWCWIDLKYLLLAQAIQSTHLFCEQKDTSMKPSIEKRSAAHLKFTFDALTEPHLISGNIRGVSLKFIHAK